MRFLINGVKCDVFAHIDRRTVSDTLNFSLSQNKKSEITAFLYCDGKVFPIASHLQAECCVKGKSNERTVICTIGESGEIIIPILDIFRISGECLTCEIAISGTDKNGANFQYRAATFIVAVTE